MAGAHFRLGTRGSALALAQAQTVADALGGAELVAITTSGDRGDCLRTRSGGGRGMLGDKSRFVREIERALLDGEVDLAVHSAKDLPGELPHGLEIAGVPEREDPRDAFVGTAGSLAEVPEGARIGTSSLRRRAQLLALRPDLEIAELRGNVDTRLAKLDSEQLDGLVLAAAGLNRLGRASEVAFAFDPAELTPAPGQGALAIESRLDDPAEARAQTITDRDALAALSCERSAVAELDASCNTPLGVHAELTEGGGMRARGFCGLPDGSDWIRDVVEADASDPEAIGHDLAERMKGAGAVELLAKAESMVVGS
jgi:hydroxymethylbilane synthase